MADPKLPKADRDGFEAALKSPLDDIDFPDYRLSSAINIWHKTGTYGCFCGFKR
jgi:hypothetical protein